MKAPRKKEFERIIDTYLNDLIGRHPVLKPIRDQIEHAAVLIVNGASSGAKLLICGNGGSAADADHIVGELMKSFVRPRALDDVISKSLGTSEEAAMLSAHLQEGIPAVALTQHTALNSAFSNDVEPALAFAQQVNVLGENGDIFWGLSTSGNSKNVVYAAMTARAKGLSLIGMTGENGGRLASLCDVCIRVPETETYKVQELHLPIYHSLCLIAEACFW